MKNKKLKHLFFLLIVLNVITDVSICAKYLTTSVHAQSQHDNVSSQTIDKLTDPSANFVFDQSNSLPFINTRQTFSILQPRIAPSSDGSNDYVLTDDPAYPERTITNAAGQTITVPQGKTAHVWNAKQFLHAVYGNYYVGVSGENGGDSNSKIPYANSLSDQYGHATDITSIVLEKDIKLVNFRNDPAIQVKDPKTGNWVKVTFSDDGGFTLNPTAAGEAFWYLTVNRPPSQEVVNGSDYSRLTIDGQGSDGLRHYLNLGKFSMQTWVPDVPRSNYDITIKNLNIYGNSYYGIIWAAAGTGNITRQTFENVNYYGAQFAWTNGSVTTTMKGTINAYSLKTYKSPDYDHDKLIYNCEGGGNQQNLQTSEIDFKPGCTYTGYTYNGNVLELSGNATFEDGSTVNLYPHGDYPEDGANGMAWGLLLTGTKPTIDLQGSAKLNVYCDGKNLADSLNNPSLNDISADLPETNQPCGAINMTTTDSLLKFDYVVDKQTGEHRYPELDVVSDGQIINNGSLIRFNSGSANLTQGTLHITANNLGKYNTANGYNGGGLMNVGSGMDINVRTGGKFSIVVGPGHDANSPLNLLYAANKMNVHIVNPADVTLDLRQDPCDASALVYADGNYNNYSFGATTKMGPYTIPRGTNVVLPPSLLAGSNSNSDIEVYDTKIRATGNNGPTSGNGIAIAGAQGTPIDPTLSPPEDVNLGMGSGIDGPIRVQRVELPFTRNLIDPLLYADGTKSVQAPDKDSFVPLKTAMFKMLGKEFRYINLTDLPSASLLLNKDSNVIYPSKGGDWLIGAESGGDIWSDNPKTNSKSRETLHTEYLPAPPLVRVQVHHDDGSTVDLGTEFNTYAAEQKANNSLDPELGVVVNPVTPNVLDDNLGNLSLHATDSKGNTIDNPNLGKMITKYPAKTTNASGQPISINDYKPIDGYEKQLPKYLAANKVTWDTNGWDESKNGEDSFDSFHHKISYNLSNLIEDYNKAHPNEKIKLKGTDQIWTSVVTNFQSSPYSVTFVSNLSLYTTEDKKKFLLGDDIKVPLNYYDGDENYLPADSKLNLTGTIDSDNKKAISGSIAIKPKTKGQTSWNIATAKPGDIGQHQIQFKAKDNANPPNYAHDESKAQDNSGATSDGDTFKWNYEVLNLPAYNVVQKITNNPYGTDKNGHQKILNGSYNLVTTYTPKANAPVHSVMFGHENTSDTPNWSNSGTGQITASYTDASGKTITATKPVASDPQKVYDPSYFGWDSSMKAFPAGIQFTIKRTIKVEATKNTPVTIGPDTIISKAADGTTQELGRSDGLNFNSVGSVVLNVPTSIDYGKKHTQAVGEIAPETAKGELSIFNDTADKQKILLTANISDSSQDPNQLFSNFLDYKYKDSKTNTTSYDNISKFKYDNSSFPADQKLLLWKLGGSDNIMEPVLKMPQSISSNNIGKHQATLTWTMTLGPN
ncbi:MAG: hypothetical protein J6573_07940 [Lactobacillus sp.]|nr:hypothetical protein [Lactobacillus sp.]